MDTSRVEMVPSGACLLYTSQRVSFDRVDFFLGATTPAGFKGYFEPLRREPGMQMVLIKMCIRDSPCAAGAAISPVGCC